MIAFVVMIFLPNNETKVEDINIKSYNCLSRLKDINLYLFFVFGIKWIMSAYRLIIYYRSKKQTSQQVQRMQNEITRNIHGEQYGPNMVLVMALIFSLFTYFSIDSKKLLTH